MPNANDKTNERGPGYPFEPVWGYHIPCIQKVDEPKKCPCHKNWGIADESGKHTCDANTNVSHFDD